MNKEIKDAIDLIKTTDINGCITGSCLLDVDFDEWEQAPDIDIFVYTREAFVNAIDQMMYRFGYTPGESEDRKAIQREQWKIDRTITRGMHSNKINLSTVKLHGSNGVVVNISHKKGQESVCDVITNFDMSIIMKGWDIRKRFMFDQTGEEPMVAVPNHHRDQDADLYNTAQWIRQFDRVIKYWNRGFDTRPMAKFYIDLIDKVIENGAMFPSEKAMEAFEEYTKDFRNVREKIQLWLEDKENLNETI